MSDSPDSPTQQPDEGSSNPASQEPDSQKAVRSIARLGDAGLGRGLGSMVINLAEMRQVWQELHSKSVSSLLK